MYFVFDKKKTYSFSGICTLEAFSFILLITTANLYWYHTYTLGKKSSARHWFLMETRYHYYLQSYNVWKDYQILIESKTENGVSLVFVLSKTEKGKLESLFKKEEETAWLFLYHYACLSITKLF